MPQISVSRQQWIQTFHQMGWDSPIPEQIWDHLGGGDNAMMDWPRLYGVIHSLGWSDQHAEVLWVALKKTIQSPAVIVPADNPHPAGPVAPQAPQPPAPYPAAVAPQPVQSAPQTPSPSAPARPPMISPEQVQEVDTPVYSNREPARWFSRLGGSLLDSLIYSIPMMIVGAVVSTVLVGSIGFTSTNPVTGKPTFDPGGLITAMIPVILITALVPIIYTWLTMKREGEKNGQTIGKGVVGVRITTIDGGPVATKEILMREVVGKWILLYAATVILTIVFAPLVILLWIAWWVIMPWRDPYNRCPHDLVAGTRPVQA